MIYTPLRARPEDIEPLARFFLRRSGQENGLPVPELTPELLNDLRGHDWPGNVRELENVIERLVVLSGFGQSAAELTHLDRPPYPFRRRPDGTEDVTSLVQRAVRLAVEANGDEGSLYERFLRVVIKYSTMNELQGIIEKIRNTNKK